MAQLVELRDRVGSCTYFGLMVFVSLSVSCTLLPAVSAQSSSFGETGNPSEAGYYESRLDAVKEILETEANYGCMSIMKDGKLITSHAWGNRAPLTDDQPMITSDGYVQVDINTPLRVNSVSKSMVSAMVGVALQEGYLDSLDEVASNYIDSWQDTLSENVTIRQLLTMTSGRYYSVTADYFWPGIIGTSFARDPEYSFDYSIYSTDALWQQYWPGTYWEYNNAGIQALEVVLEKATGFANVDDFARKYIYEPLDMNNTYFSVDELGNPSLPGGLKTTCLDYLRFGQLYLQNGTWYGEEILPEGYVELTTGTTGPSTTLNGAYGYQWWRPNHHDETVLPWVGAQATYVESTDVECGVEYKRDGREDILSNLPKGSYLAAGVFGMCFIVNPEEKLLIAKFSADGAPMLNSCNELYRRLEMSKIGGKWESQSSANGCDLKDPDSSGALDTFNQCYTKGTRCSPIRSSLLSFFFSPSPSCCDGLRCTLTYNREFGCF